MDAKQFSSKERRKAYLADLEEIVPAAFKMIPPGKISVLKAILPTAKAPGYREGHEEHLRAQLRKMKSLLGAGIESGKYWSAPTKLWVEWVDLVPPLGRRVPRLYDILIQFDNRSDQANPPNSQRDIECFEYLREKSLANEIDRETIYIFYKLGHFLPDEQIEAIIQSCKPKEEILAHIGILDRLSDLEDKIAPIDETVVDVSSSLERQSELTTEIKNLAEATASRAEPLFAIVNEHSKIIDEIQNNLIGIRRSISELKKSEITKGKNRGDFNYDELFERIYKALEKRIAKEVEAKQEIKTVVAGVGLRATEKPEYPDIEAFVEHLAGRLRHRGVVSGNEDVLAAGVIAGFSNHLFLSCRDQSIIQSLRESLSWNNESLAKFVVDGSWSTQVWASPFQEDFPFLRGMADSGEFGFNAPRFFVFEDYDRSFPEAYVLPSLKTLRSIRSNAVAKVVFAGTRTPDQLHTFPHATFYSHTIDLSDSIFDLSLSQPFMASVCTLGEKHFQQLRGIKAESSTDIQAMLNSVSDLTGKFRLNGSSEYLECLEKCIGFTSKYSEGSRAIEFFAKTSIAPTLLSLGASPSEVAFCFKPFQGLTDDVLEMLRKVESRYPNPEGIA